MRLFMAMSTITQAASSGGRGEVRGLHHIFLHIPDLED